MTNQRSSQWSLAVVAWSLLLTAQGAESRKQRRSDGSSRWQNHQDHRRLSENNNLWTVLKDTWLDSSAESSAANSEVTKCRHPDTGEIIYLKCDERGGRGGKKTSKSTKSSKLLHARKGTCAPTYYAPLSSMPADAGMQRRLSEAEADPDQKARALKGDEKQQSKKYKYNDPEVPFCTPEQLYGSRKPTRPKVPKQPSPPTSPPTSPTARPVAYGSTPAPAKNSKPTWAPVRIPATSAPATSAPATSAPVPSPGEVATLLPSASGAAVPATTPAPVPDEEAVPTPSEEDVYCYNIAQGTGTPGPFGNEFTIEGVLFAERVLGDADYSLFQAFAQQGVAPQAVNCHVDWSALLSVISGRRLASSSISTVVVEEFVPEKMGIGEECMPGVVSPPPGDNNCVLGSFITKITGDHETLVHDFPSMFLNYLVASIGIVTPAQLGLTGVGGLGLRVGESGSGGGETGGSGDGAEDDDGDNGAGNATDAGGDGDGMDTGGEDTDNATDTGGDGTDTDGAGDGTGGTGDGTGTGDGADEGEQVAVEGITDTDNADGLPSSSVGPAPIIAVVFAGLAVLVVVIFGMRRKNKAYDSHKHQPMLDDYEDEDASTFFGGDESTALGTANQLPAAVVDEDDDTTLGSNKHAPLSYSLVNSGLPRSVVADDDEDDISPALVDGTMLHSPNETCSSPNCQHCEARRQHSTVQFIAVDDEDTPHHQTSQMSPGKRNYTTFDTVDL